MNLRDRIAIEYVSADECRSDDYRGNEPNEPGWYWWLVSFQGDMESDPYGPYATNRDAFEAALPES